MPASYHVDPEATIATLKRKINKLECELDVKSQFLSARQCPDHSGKWERGRCLQCEIEMWRGRHSNLRATLERLWGRVAPFNKRLIDKALDRVQTQQNSDGEEQK